MEVKLLLIAGGSYLWGSVLWGYVLARLRGLPDFGTRDLPGGAGSIRQMGFLWGALVGLLDIAKAALAVRLARALAPSLGPGPEGLAVAVAVGAAALGVVLGHCWPIFFRFRGGLTVSGVLGTALGLGLYGPLAAGFLTGAAATGLAEVVRRRSARGRLPLFLSPVAFGGTVGHAALLLALLVGDASPGIPLIFALQGLIGIVRGLQVRRLGLVRAAQAGSE